MENNQPDNRKSATKGMQSNDEFKATPREMKLSKYDKSAGADNVNHECMADDENRYGNEEPIESSSPSEIMVVDV
jgi:hypothetical protein